MPLTLSRHSVVRALPWPGPVGLFGGLVCPGGLACPADGSVLGAGLSRGCSVWSGRPSLSEGASLSWGLFYPGGLVCPGRGEFLVLLGAQVCPGGGRGMCPERAAWVSQGQSWTPRRGRPPFPEDPHGEGRTRTHAPCPGPPLRPIHEATLDHESLLN